MILLIHEVKKSEDLFLKDDTTPDSISTDNAELKMVQTIIKLQLDGGDMDKWNKCFGTFMRVSDEK